MMYDAYVAHSDVLWPLRTWARHTADWLHRHPLPAWVEQSLGWPLPGLASNGSGPSTFAELAQAQRRQVAAACELIDLAQVTHQRPDYQLGPIATPEGELTIHEEVVLRRPFCSLLRFAARDAAGQEVVRPRLLIVAPMSGHFATLLRDTVRVALTDHEVYITDWHNARDVPLSEGRFGLDEYIEDLMLSLRHLGPGTHMLGICQPCVAALAATALMAEDEDPAAPASLTLMAGPVDCRVQPTEVNHLATSKPMSWFEHHLIATVPARFAGRWRRVYPGFMQLTAFMSMNLPRHTQSLTQYRQQLARGEHEEAAATRRFYEEYFAVADLPAEFYLETVRLVFQEYALARGELQWRGRLVRPQAIRRTLLLTVEGERDDICSIGQTLAAHDLCSSIKPMHKQHYVQAGAGHYGVFSGRRWEQQIYPLLRDTVHQADTLLHTRAAAH